MMNLMLHRAEGHHEIRRYGTDGILIGETCYAEGVIVAAEETVSAWQAPAPGELAPEHLEPVLELSPDIVLLGTGERQVFPPIAVLKRFAQARIGCEVMDTGAACRTFNVLASEGRSVVAALMPLADR
ncbi:MAG: Mth938-like domain-containing protein [Pseudomonadota bacterium]